MQQSDYDDFKVLLESVTQLYGKLLSSDAIVLWWGALKHYDLPAVREGLSRHIQNPDTGQFMPKPADVVRLIGGTTQDSALQAWAKVDKAARGLGPYVSVVFDDPIIHAVLADMGGWTILGNKTEHEWPFVAREFENRYRSYRTLGRIEHYPPVLTGIADLQNESNGLPVSEPVLIGDKEQAIKTRHFGQITHKTVWHRLDAEKTDTVEQSRATPLLQSRATQSLLNG